MSTTDSQRLDRIIDAVVEQRRDITEIKVTLAAQHESLVQHMKRTALLEEAIQPLIKERHMIHGVLKVVGALGMAIGAIGTILSIVKHITG